MKKNYFVKSSKTAVYAFLILLCGLFANPVLAQKNIGWTGATDNNWSTPTNWNYPAITSVATYATNSTTITLTAANTDIAVGDKVAGFGIAAGATVTAIDAAQKIVTISPNTIAAVGTPGTNVVFTFATPKAASGAPTIVDIASISNGANPTLTSGSYYLGGLTISNMSGSVGGSTFTIPSDVEVFVESSTNEAVLVKGGNIVNNGFFDIKSSLTVGSNNTVGAYGMTFGLPDAVPSVPTEYTYSGTGTLKIDTSAGNNFSGGILFNGADANAANATYKLLFNGTTNFLLSSVKASGTGAASTQAIRVAGISALQSCKIVLGGVGFDIGDAFSGGNNGFLSTSGGGIEVTIARETTINVYTNINNPMAVIGMYAFGATAIPSFIINKGTINMSGTMFRSSPISLSAQNDGTVNLVNDGIMNVNIYSSASGTAGISVTNNQGATAPATVNVTNTGTLSIKNLLNGAAWGAPIAMTTFSGAPNLHVNNSGTLNLIGSNHSFGAKVYNAANVLTQTGTSRITNSGTINTNQELRTFYTINTSTGTINFATTNDSPLKLTTFTVPTAAAAAVGTTYTDANSNLYTVAVAKVAATGTTLVAHVASNAVNPLVTVAAPGPPEVFASTLTKTGAGTGDSSIVFTALVTNNNNALFQPVQNSGTINTNSGSAAMTGINGYTTPDGTAVLSPGGDTGRSIASFDNVAGDLLTLRGTLKMQATGSTAAGIDYDQLKFSGGLDVVDISAATLDLTGIYIPTVLTTIDIIITSTSPLLEGGIIGEFANIVGKPQGWSVVYPGGLGGKVQLTFDPSTLATTKFSNFKFSAFPNPTTDQLNLSAAKTISKVDIFNLLGQRVQSETINAMQKQLSISNLQKGLYVMEVTIDNAKESFKIMKQ